MGGGGGDHGTCPTRRSASSHLRSPERDCNPQGGPPHPAQPSGPVSKAPRAKEAQEASSGRGGTSGERPEVRPAAVSPVGARPSSPSGSSRYPSGRPRRNSDTSRNAATRNLGGNPSASLPTASWNPTATIGGVGGSTGLAVSADTGAGQAVAERTVAAERKRGTPPPRERCEAADTTRETCRGSFERST